jgi:hypothetical protein
MKQSFYVSASKSYSHFFPSHYFPSNRTMGTYVLQRVHQCVRLATCRLDLHAADRNTFRFLANLIPHDSTIRNN